MKPFLSTLGLFLASLVSAAGSPAQIFSATRDITFTANCDGTEQRYVLLLPVDFDTEESHDLLMVFHGHGSDRWQYVRDARDECKAARDFAAEHRMLFVSPDYRAPTSWMGPKAEVDVVQNLDELQRSYRIDRTFLCGASMGGSAVLTFAVLHPDRVDGVASINGTANLLEYVHFQEAIIESFGGAKAAVPLEYKNRSAEYWPERFSMPVALVVSGQDEVVPPQSVQRLAAALEILGRKVLLLFREELGHQAEYRDVTEALEFMLKKARPSLSNQPVKEPPHDDPH